MFILRSYNKNICLFFKIKELINFNCDFKILIILIFLFNFSFTYAQISSENLKLWYIGDSVVLEGGFVSEWTDYSGNNLHAIQTTNNNRPIQTNTIYNIHSAVRFDGTNDYLITNFLDSLEQPITVFVVWKKNATKQQTIFDGLANGYRMSFSYPYSNIELMSVLAGGLGNGLTYTKPLTDQLSINSIIFSSNSKVFDNGVLKGSSPNVGNNYVDGFILGSYYNFTRFFNGDITEFIVYDTEISAEQRVDVENYLIKKYAPALELGEDIEVTYGFCDVALNIGSSFTDILWSTGETTDTIHVNKSGQYFVQAKNIFGKICYDTINVTFPTPNINDEQICLGDSVLFSPQLSGTYSYNWSNISTEPQIYIKDAGNYWLRMEDNSSCFDTVSFSVVIDSFPAKISLGSDVNLCSGNIISLVEGEDLCTTFLWTTNSNTQNTQIVTETGWQFLEVTNENNCFAKDSVFVNIIGTIPLIDCSVQNLCFGDTTKFYDLSSSQDNITYREWIINNLDTLKSQNIEFLFETFGDHNIKFKIGTESGCYADTSFNIIIKELPDVAINYESLCVNIDKYFTSEIVLPENVEISTFSWKIDNMEVSSEPNMSYSFSSGGEYNLSFRIETNNDCSVTIDSIIEVPEYFELEEKILTILPSNNIVLAPTATYFNWNNYDNAFYYEIIFASDSDFENILFTQSNILENYTNIDIDFGSDSVYWKVRKYDPCLNFSESQVNFINIFSPLNIGNIKLWAHAGNVQETNGFVDTVFDNTMNGFNFVQHEQNKKPTVFTNEFNNQKYLKFDGVNDFMKSNFGQSFPQPASIFIVWRHTKKINQTIFDSYSQPGFTFIFPYAALNALTFRAGPYIGLQYDKALSINTSIHSIMVSATSKLYENGILKVTNSTIGTNPQDGFTIGSSSAGNHSFFNGEIAEIIYFDTIISDTSRIQIEQYLRNKYSPPLSLGYDIRVPYGFCDTAISAYKPWFTSYLWSTGETDSVIHVNKPGVYSCTVTDIFGFESSDDIRVFYPQVNNFADTIICYGNSVIWDAELTGDYSYEWLGSPETTQSIEIFYEGDYALIITDSLGCKYYSDTINFSFDKYELTASIGPADTLLCAGNRLSLATNSDETVSYLWSTGAETPEITLSESGTYSVTCTNWRACSAKDEIAVTIMGTVPNPDFSVQGHCAKNLISFNDQSTSPEGNINFWQWFVNGEVFASSQNSEITLDEPGNYNIRLQIKTDLDCGDYLDETIEVFPLPEPKFFPDYYCQWAEIDFISKTTILSGNILNNYWQFNDFDLFGDTVSYVFENSGINTVKLISESEQACRDSIIKEIFVKQAVKPDFLSQNACVNSESSFINITEQSSYNLPVSWNWNFGDGNFGENSDPSHVYENSGIYDVSLSVVWQNTCETSITKQIEIYDNPELELLVENSCVNSEFTVAKNIESQSGEIVEYIWNFNGNEIISNTDASPTFVCDTIGEYPISLEIKSEYGCEAFAQDTIKVYPLPQVDFAMSRDWGGFPFTVDFTNLSQGASQYLWSFGDSESSIEENPTHIYISEGEFFVNLTAVSEYGCSDYIEKKIISVNPIMDLILYDLRTKLNGNYLEISVYIINNGTLPVSKPELVLNLGEGKIYRESLDSIPVSQVIDYTLKTEIWRAEKTLPEIICLEVFANPYEGHYENNTEDNLICSANVKNLLVFQPYPNPTNQSLNIEYILAKPAECLITITNSMGKQVYVNKFENQTQYNKLELDVSEFAVGVYYLQVQSGGERESRKVVVY